jgi:hypothetical protein
MALIRHQRIILLVATSLFILALLRLYLKPQFASSLTYLRSSENYLRPTFAPGVAKGPSETYTKTIVMARLKSQDVSWVYSDLDGFNKSIYTVDGDKFDTGPRVPQNKGHEGMVYLTYIIENYDNLPDVVLFFHPHRSTWHNNILLDLDSVKTIRRLNPAHVAREGYFNARCHHDPGCPNWLHIDRPETEWDFVKKKEEQYLTSEVWRQLHPGEPIPQALSQPCCAQFAVSGQRIRARPLANYIQYREWLLNTTLSDEFSGRILEYNWQYIFTGQGELCPPQHECYCDGFGICFGGTNDENLQHWLNLLREREILDERLSELRLDEEKHIEDIASAEIERSALIGRLEFLKAEAYHRGESPKDRALECGRAWKQGGGF